MRRTIWHPESRIVILHTPCFTATIHNFYITLILSYLVSQEERNKTYTWHTKFTYVMLQKELNAWAVLFQFSKCQLGPKSFKCISRSQILFKWFIWGPTLFWAVLTSAMSTGDVWHWENLRITPYKMRASNSRAFFSSNLCSLLPLFMA